MRYAKRILVAAAIFSSYSAALAFDKKEIDSSGGNSPLWCRGSLPISAESALLSIRS